VALESFIILHAGQNFSSSGGIKSPLMNRPGYHQYNNITPYYFKKQYFDRAIMGL
jgi:hypothetical protein